MPEAQVPSLALLLKANLLQALKEVHAPIPVAPEDRRYYQSTGKAHANVLQSLRVQSSDPSTVQNPSAFNATGGLGGLPCTGCQHLALSLLNH